MLNSCNPKQRINLDHKMSHPEECRENSELQKLVSQIFGKRFVTAVHRKCYIISKDILLVFASITKKMHISLYYILGTT